MDLAEAQELCLGKMSEHNLNNWKFKWLNKGTRYGQCSSHEQTIWLSKVYVQYAGIAEVTDTILHEIAHAHVGCRNGHNATWKRCCIEIGANPNRLSNFRLPSETFDYVAECPTCHQKFYTNSKKRLGQSYICKDCKVLGKAKKFQYCSNRIVPEITPEVISNRIALLMRLGKSYEQALLIANKI